MEKFKKVIDLKSGLVGINKFDKFIYGELEMRSGGDWSNYDEGDIISYDFELLSTIIIFDLFGIFFKHCSITLELL